MDNAIDAPAQAGSNSLPDLAARINAEHEAISGALQSGMQHAIAAGQLLIEAKKVVPHSGWLAWIGENCAFSERTAQAYMRVARSLANMSDQAKAQRVADLSFRDALQHVPTGVNRDSQGAPQEQV